MQISTVISTRVLIDPKSFSSHPPRGLDTIRFPEHKVHTAHVAPVQHGRASGTMRRGYIHAGRYVVSLNPAASWPAQPFNPNPPSLLIGLRPTSVMPSSAPVPG